ncbi:MAG: hypothetical protein AB8A67_08640, partial [Prochlorococcus sp.]
IMISERVKPLASPAPGMGRISGYSQRYRKYNRHFALTFLELAERLLTITGVWAFVLIFLLPQEV